MSLAEAGLEAMAVQGELHPFSIRGAPLLLEGSTMTLLTDTPALSVHLKVYADGGENALHNHPHEDHLFFVLQGQAIFLDGRMKETTVGVNQGMTVPRGTDYCFRTSGDGNLVMLRFGTPVGPARNEDGRGAGAAFGSSSRLHPDGSDFDGYSAANKTGAQAGVPSGARFGV